MIPSPASFVTCVWGRDEYWPVSSPTRPHCPPPDPQPGPAPVSRTQLNQSLSWDSNFRLISYSVIDYLYQHTNHHSILNPINRIWKPVVFMFSVSKKTFSEFIQKMGFHTGMKWTMNLDGSQLNVLVDEKLRLILSHIIQATHNWQWRQGSLQLQIGSFEKSSNRSSVNNCAWYCFAIP